MLKRLAIPAMIIMAVAGPVVLKSVRPVYAQSSPVVVPTGTITSYVTEWSHNQVIVNTTAPPINPGSCRLGVGSGYETDPNNTTVEQSALLAAFLSGKQVNLVVQGCTGDGSPDRPMILGVQVLP